MFQTGDPQTIQIKRPEVNMTICQTPTGVSTQESDYFTDLNWATSDTITGDQLLMFDKTGKKILQFDRMSS